MTQTQFTRDFKIAKQAQPTGVVSIESGTFPQPITEPDWMRKQQQGYQPAEIEQGTLGAPQQG